MGKLDLKTIAIIVLPIATMALVYFLFFNSSNSPVEGTDKRKNNIPIPEVEKEEISNNKSDVYKEKLNRIKEEENKRRRSTVSESDFYNLVGANQGEEKEKANDIPEPLEEAEIRVIKETSPKPVIEKRVVYVEKTEKVEEPRQTTEPTQTSTRSGFGIVMGGNQTTTEKASALPESNKGFISVILEESLEIKTGTSVVFICGEAFWHQGQKINKNALLFGKAHDAGSVFEIRIDQIKNTDGKIMAASNLVVFDERYSRGLAHSGAMNKAVDDGMNEGVADITRDMTSATTRGTPGAVAINALDRTLSSMTRQKQRENSISLHKGYRVYVKQLN